MMRLLAAAFLGLWAGTAAALDLPANAQVTREETNAFATLSLPVTGWSDDGMDTVSQSGAVTRRAWRVPSSSLTTLQAAGPIRRDLEEQGFDVLFDCATQDCGGFDFRYALDLLPEPEMHVNLGDFRFLTATRDAPKELLGVMISRAATDLFIHESRVSDEPLPPAEIAQDPQPPVPAPRLETVVEPAPETEENGALVERLTRHGRVVLDDLEFSTGSAALEPRTFPTLIELAAWLNATPDVSVVLVGHSDSVGGLDGNIALSRQRAQSVVDRLISAHGVAPGQLRAEGIGFLAPVASNATPEGRALNRRVEAVFVETG